MQRIYRLRDLPAVTGLSKSTLYEMMARGEFPKPIKLARRAVGWRSDAVEQWLDEREQVAAE